MAIADPGLENCMYILLRFHSLLLSFIVLLSIPTGTWNILVQSHHHWLGAHATDIFDPKDLASTLLL